MTTQTLDEAARMKRVPGIIFVDSAAGGRVARIAGTGLEVWEIIWSYIGLDRDRDELGDWFDWLTPEQLSTALIYYDLFPAEIDWAVEENNRCIEELKRAHPWSPVTSNA